MTIDLNDSGFLYGQGVFETMRTYDGKIFCLDDHLDRLSCGAKIIGLKLASKNSLRRLIQVNIRNKKSANCRVKLVCFQARNRVKSAVIITNLCLLPKYFTAVISSIRQNENSPLCHIKSLNYLNFWLALKEAQKQSKDEAILLNSKGYLCEGSRSNLFFIKDNCLFTPLLSCGCLEGITRKVVLEIARQEEIKIKQGRFKKADLFNCDEAFLTNSLIELMPLTEVDNRKINKGKIGKFTKFLINKYKSKIKI